MKAYYEITVSFRNKSLFATAPGSCRTMNKAKKVFDALTKAFDGYGYAVLCRFFDGKGEIVNLARARSKSRKEEYPLYDFFTRKEKKNKKS